MPPSSGDRGSAAEEAATLPPAESGVDLGQTIDHVLPHARGASSSPEGYEIEAELGRGGMGVVYRARQIRLGRTVALKMILAGGHAGPTERERFTAEAQAVARLQHPNIVQIHEVGDHDGLPYFALEYCAGGSLDKNLSGTPLKSRDAAALVEKLAGAVQAVHTKGIIHRDLKPANVLLTADGTPKITDFGLAKLDDQSRTATNAVLGTPSYMAPEQAEGKSRKLTPACDIYALGAILYECLTGRPPFRAATPLDTVLQVVSEEPVPPRLLNPRVPLDLETLCLKCLQKEVRHRYRSAEHLGADLGRFLRGEPILARPVSPLGRTIKWIKRKPMLAAFWGLAALFLVTLAIAGPWVALRQSALREEADQNRVLAEEAAAKAKREAHRANTARQSATLNLALREWKRGNLANAGRLLDDADSNLVGWELDFLRNLIPRQSLSIPHSPPHAVAFNGDGKRIAFLREETARERADRKPAAPASYVTVQDIDSSNKIAEFRIDGTRQGGFEENYLDPAGRRLALPLPHPDPKAKGRLDQIHIFDVATGKKLQSLEKPMSIRCLSFSPDGTRVGAGGFDGLVRVWDAATGEEVHTFPLAADDGIHCVAFSPDGRQLFAGGGYLQARLVILGLSAYLWDLPSGKQRWEYRCPGLSFRVARHRGDRIVAVIKNADLMVWPVASGQPGAPRAITGPIRLPSCLNLNEQGTLLAASADRVEKQEGGTAATLHLVPVVMEAKAYSTRKMEEGPVHSVALGPKGRLLAATAYVPRARILTPKPGEVKVWDRVTGRSFPVPDFDRPVVRLAFSPDGKWLAAALGGRRSRGKEPAVPAQMVVWDVETGKTAGTFPFDADSIWGLRFAPDSDLLAVASVVREKGLDILGYVTMASVREKRVLHATPVPNLPHEIAFTPSIEVFAAGGMSGVGVLDVGGILPRQKLKHGTAVAFAPDAKTLLGVSVRPDITALESSGVVTAWDWKTGEELHTHDFRLTGALLSWAVIAPDTRRFATSSDDGTLRIWDAATGQEMLTLEGPASQGECLSFSHDGLHIAVGHKDGAIAIWDAAPLR